MKTDSQQSSVLSVLTAVPYYPSIQFGLPAPCHNVFETVAAEGVGVLESVSFEWSAHDIYNFSAQRAVSEVGVDPDSVVGKIKRPSLQHTDLPDRFDGSPTVPFQCRQTSEGPCRQAAWPLPQTCG